MSKVNLNQQVRYFPGVVPCAGAKVTVYDVDSGGDGDDVIFTGTTNSTGYFSGTSKDWDDRNTVRFGRFTRTIPDVLMLQIRIAVDGHDTGRQPFAVAPVGVPTPPIILPFGPPAPATLFVDGEPCNNPADFHDKVKGKLQAGQPRVKLTIRGPESVVLKPLTGSLDALKDLVDDMLPGIDPILASYRGVVDPATTILALAVLALAIAAGIAVTTVAGGIVIALILALLLGYCDISVVEKPGNADNPLPGLEFTVAKC